MENARSFQEFAEKVRGTSPPCGGAEGPAAGGAAGTSSWASRRGSGGGGRGRLERPLWAFFNLFPPIPVCFRGTCLEGEFVAGGGAGFWLAFGDGRPRGAASLRSTPFPAGRPIYSPPPRLKCHPDSSQQAGPALHKRERHGGGQVV